MEWRASAWRAAATEFTRRRAHIFLVLFVVPLFFVQPRTFPEKKRTFRFLKSQFLDFVFDSLSLFQNCETKAIADDTNNNILISQAQISIPINRFPR
jgi:hypothetical protein